MSGLAFPEPGAGKVLPRLRGAAEQDELVRGTVEGHRGYGSVFWDRRRRLLVPGTPAPGPGTRVRDEGAANIGSAADQDHLEAGRVVGKRGGEPRRRDGRRALLDPVRAAPGPGLVRCVKVGDAIVLGPAEQDEVLRRRVIGHRGAAEARRTRGRRCQLPVRTGPGPRLVLDGLGTRDAAEEHELIRRRKI